MSHTESYTELLEATIQHLEQLKAQGEQYVALSPETVQLLKAAQPAKATEGPVPAASAQSATRTPPPLPTKATPALPTPTGTRTPPPQRSTEYVLHAAPPARTPPAVSGSRQPVATPGPATPVPGSKEARMAALVQRINGCVKCPNLARARKRVVPGTGNLNAALMFIGEAPGADEDRQGEPFVGAAGQLLNKIINAMGLKREDVYIANILKCRPDTPGQPSGNRKPTPQEMNTCVGYLQEQIEIIAPKVIVALGATAVLGLLGLEGINKLRGRWHTYKGLPLMPTFHPAYLLHTQNNPNAEKRKVWEDMLQVMEKLGLSISEKQRGYFR